MRNLIRFAMVLVACIAVPRPQAESPATLPAPTGYIDDYASVLSPVAKSEFENLCIEVHNKTRAQVFVVTVNTLDGSSIDQFANDLFHRWKIGEKKTDRGVLLIFAVRDHKWRIEVGYGLEPVLNDAKVGDIGRAMVPDLHAAEWDDGIRTGLRAVAQDIAEDSKVQLDSLQPDTTSVTEQAPPPVQPAPASSQLGDNTVGLVVFMIFFIGIFAFVIFSIIRSVRNGVSAVTGGSSFTSGGSSFFSSSDSSSFSSSDSSSTSDSFSGGDGGDSGGGGASGDF